MKDLIKWSSVLYLNMTSCLDKRLAKFDINSSQFFYIFRICENPGITRECIVDTVFRNQSNVTRALIQLEEKGYIRKVPSREDRRTCYLYPTPKAEHDYEEIHQIIQSVIDEIMEPFSEEEQKILPELLKKAAVRAYESNLREREKERKEVEEE